MSVVPQVPVMGDTLRPRPTYLLIRGVYTDHGDEVQPQGLAQIFPWDSSLPRTRIGLARWLFDPKHPLTSRVFVNRMWQRMFGRGLVETSEDFGAQGSIPSHPELLDWLAVSFVESGWNVKALMKQFVMSATFRQSSVISDELLKKDPRNLLLARFSRVRMPAEMVRDNALAASGCWSARWAAKAHTVPARWDMGWAGCTAIRRPTRFPSIHIIAARLLVHQTERAAPRDGEFRHAGSRHERRPPPDVEHAAAGARAPRRSAVRRGVSRAGGERAARHRRSGRPRDDGVPTGDAASSAADEATRLRRYYDTQLARYATDAAAASALLKNGVTPMPEGSTSPASRR